MNVLSFLSKHEIDKSKYSPYPQPDFPDQAFFGDTPADPICFDEVIAGRPALTRPTDSPAARRSRRAPQGLTGVLPRPDGGEAGGAGAPATAIAGKMVTSFKHFPHRQKPSSFNLDDVMNSLTAGGEGK